MEFARDDGATLPFDPSLVRLPALDLPGPSRRIVVEPVEAPDVPIEVPEREPSAPDREPGHSPGPVPEPAPEKTPA